MVLRATAAIRVRPPRQSHSQCKPNNSSSKSQPRLPPPEDHHHQNNPLLSSTAPAAIALFALFSTPNAFCEAKAIAFSKEDIVSSLTKVEDTLDKVGDAGSKALGFSQQVIKVGADALKPAVDVAVPMLRSADGFTSGFRCFKTSKTGPQSAGVDASTVLSAAKELVQSLEATSQESRKDRRLC